MTAAKTEPATGLLPALLAVQAEAPTLAKNATNPHFKSKYAPLDTIVETVGPILAKHKLVWMTFPGRDEDGEPSLTYRLAHAPTGEVVEGSMPLLLSKRDAQGQGSAITYARRYALCAVLNLVADDDDDGHAAGQATSRGTAYGADVANPKQLNYLKSLVKKHKVTTGELRAVLRGAGVEIADDANPAPVVATLTKAQASKVIEFLAEKPVPTGESDVPSDASEFTHPPEEPGDLFEQAATEGGS